MPDKKAKKAVIAYLTPDQFDQLNELCDKVMVKNVKGLPKRVSKSKWIGDTIHYFNDHPLEYEKLVRYIVRDKKPMGYINLENNCEEVNKRFGKTIEQSLKSLFIANNLELPIFVNDNDKQNKMSNFNVFRYKYQLIL